jgi:hypothetical protein
MMHFADYDRTTGLRTLPGVLLRQSNLCHMSYVLVDAPVTMSASLMDTAVATGRKLLSTTAILECISKLIAAYVARQVLRYD